MISRYLSAGMNFSDATDIGVRDSARNIRYLNRGSCGNATPNVYRTPGKDIAGRVDDSLRLLFVLRWRHFQQESGFRVQRCQTCEQSSLLPQSSWRFQREHPIESLPGEFLGRV